MRFREERKANLAIRQLMTANGICMYEVADRLKVSESAFYRWMRHSLSAEQETMVSDAIKEIITTRTEIR